MWPLSRSTVVLALLHQVLAGPATISLGDLNQYKGSATATPTLTGKAVAIQQNSASTETGIPSDGIDIFFSADLQADLTSTINTKCQDLNDACYTALQDTIVNSNSELEPRALGAVVIAGTVLMGLISMAIPAFYKEHKTIPVPMHFPPAVIRQASAAVSATVVVMATGTAEPTITITPKPEATGLKGSAPSISTLTADANGHHKGDVIISMPSDLASRAQEIIARSDNGYCSAWRKSPQQIRKAKRAADFSSVICASETLLINAQPGGALSDLLILRPKHGMAFTGADAAAALNVVMGMARDFASALLLPPEVAEQIGIAVFSIAWEIFINGKTLSGENVIPAESLSSASGATSGCSTTTKQCQVGCSIIGSIKGCETDCQTKTISQCGGSSTSSKLTTTTVIPWTPSADVTLPATSATTTPQQAPLPIPSDKTASCGGSLPANFPPQFALLDKWAPVSEIIYRMRDQACQNLCQNIQGVPGNLMTAKKQGNTGCEYAAKLSSGKEVYLYSTGSGDNCYKGTQLAIDGCMTDKNDGKQIHDSGWVNGPNYGEFFQVGVRDLNDPTSSHHDPLTTDTTQHLGHRYVACNRPGNNPFADNYEVYISGWDDNDWGKTIQDAMGECHLSVTGWKYEDNSQYTYSDGTKNQKIAKFNTVLSNGGCIESKIEKAMGLRGGGVNCPYNRAEELDMFK